MSQTQDGAAMQGFFYPRTASGRSSLLPTPPWFYSGDLLTVEYRTDPERVAALLPEPLALAAEDPGAVALIWADWQSCGADRAELLDPVRSQYKEAFVVVRCSFEGRTYSRCAFIWVDKDFAMLRGIHQGYPKKLGSIHMTRSHPMTEGAPALAARRPVRGDPRGVRPAPRAGRHHPARTQRAATVSSTATRWRTTAGCRRSTASATRTSSSSSPAGRRRRSGRPSPRTSTS